MQGPTGVMELMGMKMINVSDSEQSNCNDGCNDHSYFEVGEVSMIATQVVTLPFAVVQEGSNQTTSDKIVTVVTQTSIMPAEDPA